MPRRHPPELRAAVLADVPTLGVSGAARKHGVGKATASRWADEAGIGTIRNEQTAAATEARRVEWEERRTAMIPRIGATADLALTRTTEALEAGNGRNAKDAATTMAILVDKAQLLSGGQTSRYGMEHRGEVVDDARHRGLALVR
jgi:transposase-like protein